MLTIMSLSVVLLLAALTTTYVYAAGHPNSLSFSGSNSPNTINTTSSTITTTTTIQTNTPTSTTYITYTTSTSSTHSTTIPTNTITNITNTIHTSTTTIPTNPTSIYTTTTTISYNTIKNSASVTTIINPVANTAIHTTVPYTGTKNSTSTIATASTIIPYVCALPAVYNYTLKGCSTPKIVSSLNLSKSQLAGLSNAIGVSINVISAISISIFNGTNSITIRCNGCTGAANNTLGITTINTNVSLSANIIKSILLSTNTITFTTMANAFSTNSILVNSIVSSSTPEGFSVLNGTTVLTNRNATSQNTVTIQWSSSKLLNSQNVSVNAIRGTATSSSAAANSLTPSQLTAQYALHYLGNASNVSVSSQAEVHAAATIRGNTSTTQYVPSNITVYGSRGTAVVSVTNLVKNVSSYVNTTSAKETFLASIVVVPKSNLTVLAAGIRIYNSSSASNAFAGNIISKQTFGNVISMMVVNSSVNDSLLNRVQYKFNVSKGLLIARNVTAGAVHLYRHNSTSGIWSALPTNLTGSNGTQYFYTATSPGMSIYAIGFGYLKTNITATNSTNILPAPTPQKMILDPLIMLAALLLAVAVVIIYFTLFKKGGSDSTPGAGVPSSPQTTEDAINAYIKEESR